MCCRCGVNAAARQNRSSYCLPCKAAYMREHRRLHPYATLSPLARFKSTMRAYANVYARRGKIQKCPCCLCGALEAEKHHPDYTQPLFIVWLCRECHLEHHLEEPSHDESHVERLAIQWDKNKSRGVKRIRVLTKYHMEARKTAAHFRRAEKKNKSTPCVFPKNESQIR